MRLSAPRSEMRRVGDYPPPDCLTGPSEPGGDRGPGAATVDPDTLLKDECSWSRPEEPTGPGPVEAIAAPEERKELVAGTEKNRREAPQDCVVSDTSKQKLTRLHRVGW